MPTNKMRNYVKSDGSPILSLSSMSTGDYRRLLDAFYHICYPGDPVFINRETAFSVGFAATIPEDGVDAIMRCFGYIPEEPKSDSGQKE